MSEEIDTPSEVNIIVNRLNDFFRYPVYTWSLAKKRALLLLGVLARWNPSMGPLYQDQLIHMCGLEVGSTSGPNALRALKIAIRRNIGITFRAQGNALNRVYTFENRDHREAILTFLDGTHSGLNIYEYLLTELEQHRRRVW